MPNTKIRQAMIITVYGKASHVIVAIAVLGLTSINGPWIKEAVTWKLPDTSNVMFDMTRFSNMCLEKNFFLKKLVKENILAKNEKARGLICLLLYFGMISI